MTLQIGQRWVADTDPGLGLGIVMEFDRRKVTIEFPAVGEVRSYGLANAPLTRILLSVGDQANTEEGKPFTVDQVELVNDLAIYLTLDDEAIVETRLSATIELHHPAKRLLASQLDKPYWFDLRSDLTDGYQRWLQSETLGLLGARILLTPHQLYVANKATSVMPVRVLLADEVGLGKTIEAGLILHRLLLTQTIKKVLILVPDALQVQWFVELLRRFCIQANLYDAELDCEEASVVIAPHSALDQEEDSFAYDWDCLIVDEAHNFDLENASVSSEHIATLATTCEHVLLLSATPERMGVESHFHRLALLDPVRFDDFARFNEQLSQYSDVASQLESIELSKIDDSSQLPNDTVRYLSEQFPDEPVSSLDTASIVELLVDCYGTGRSVFRNTRHSITGFPERQLIVHSEVASQEERYAWLAGYLKEHKNDKTLLITHRADDVLAMKAWLYQKTGQDCPVFHEGMSLVERDRAAAYFADEQTGAPLLMCSEIGSEGRNFQFCHHLICWDLPEHPDVLEQRIGRLDRIGQTETIRIHLCPQADEALGQRLHWYHDVLNCIEQCNPAAGRIHDQYFEQYCQSPEVANTAKQAVEALLSQLEAGRDRLLEMNSCPPVPAQQLVKRVIDDERKYNPEELVEQAADLLNLHYEQIDIHRYSLIPSDQMLLPTLTGIPPEGCEITFDRDTALAREDVQLVTWDHPFIQGLVDLMSQASLGSSSIALFPIKKLPPGKLLAEVMFTLTVKSPVAKEASLFLPQSTLRVLVMEQTDKNLNLSLPRESLSTIIEPAPKDISHTIIGDYRKNIEALIEKAHKVVATEQQAVITKAIEQVRERQQIELTRLNTLKRRSSAVNAQTLEETQQHYEVLSTALEQFCQPDMAAIRLLVTYQPEH